MMTESDKERFNNRICVDKLLISADVYVTPSMTVSAAEVELTVPDSDYQATQNLSDVKISFPLSDVGT
ncbi:hypothetical protein [Erwinia tasmaniensis]|nr:hypothetical protein [Erwinia tasmaniensis]